MERGGRGRGKSVKTLVNDSFYILYMYCPSCSHVLIFPSIILTG